MTAPLRSAALAVSLMLAAPQGAAPQSPHVPRPGGLHDAGSSPRYLTPDAVRNAELARGRGVDSLFGIRTDGGEAVMAPSMPAGTRWLAAFDAPAGRDTVSYFAYDGWLYTADRATSNQRRRRFDRDVSAQVSSNAYHQAYYREQGIEREIVMLVISPVRQTVRLTFDPALTGGAKSLAYEMDALEAKFLLINLVTPEHTVIAWRPEETPRQTRTLDGGWRFHKGDAAGAEAPEYDDGGGAWETVAIPHSWNTEDVFDTRRVKDALDVYEMYYRGTGWYRTRFQADSSLRGTALSLHFLGANQVADVWLNGRHLGQHIGGYTPFTLDAGSALHVDVPNVLAVRVDNSYDPEIPPRTADFNFYGGLYREVQLRATHPLHVSRVELTTPEVSWTSATVRARTTLANRLDQPRRVRLVTHVVDPSRHIVRSVVSDTIVAARDSVTVVQPDMRLADPLLWAPAHPWLYQLRTALYDESGQALDETEEPLGFRTFRFHADSGFFLNGQPLKLRGVNLHQDFLLAANAVEVEQKREDMRLVKAMGANFVRLAHYPHHPATIALADTLGLLVWEEIPVVNNVGGETYAENARQQLRETIARDFNNPSVILWGIGNEFSMPWMVPAQVARARSLAEDLHALAKALDPTRLTVQAHNHVPDETLFGVTDVQGRNRYFGWYEGTIADFAGELDRDKRTHPDWKLIISEYGADAKRGHFLPEPAQLFDFSESYQLRFHEAYLDAIDARPFVAGGAAWNMFDFGSHVKTGNLQHVNQKGLMTLDRRPKAAYYLYQSRWSEEPMIYLVSRSWVHRTGPVGEPHPIRVLSNADSVELFVDGESEGVRSRASGFTWPVMLAEGAHRLRAVGRAGGRSVTDELVIHLSHGLTAPEDSPPPGNKPDPEESRRRPPTTGAGERSPGPIRR